jgi:hypothetical protein
MQDIRLSGIKMLDKKDPGKVSLDAVWPATVMHQDGGLISLPTSATGPFYETH